MKSMRKVRLQANFRIDENDRRMVQELRRIVMTDDGKVPSETDVWRMALKRMHAAEKKRR